MNKECFRRAFMILAYLALQILRILALAGRIGHGGSELLARRSEHLLTPYPLALGLTLSVDVLFFLYIFYSLGLITPHKSEFARRFVEIADIGLCLTTLLAIARLLAWHNEAFGLALLFDLAILIFTLRVSMGYQGDPTRPFWPRFPFDYLLGTILCLSVSDFGHLLCSWNGGRAPFEPQAFALVLLLLAALLCLIAGLKQLAPGSFVMPLLSFAALAYTHLSAKGFDGRFPAVYITAIVCMPIMLAAMIVAMIQRRRVFWR